MQTLGYDSDDRRWVYIGHSGNKPVALVGDGSSAMVATPGVIPNLRHLLAAPFRVFVLTSCSGDPQRRSTPPYNRRDGQPTRQAIQVPELRHRSSLHDGRRWGIRVLQCSDRGIRTRATTGRRLTEITEIPTSQASNDGHQPWFLQARRVLLPGSRWSPPGWGVLIQGGRIEIVGSLEHIGAMNHVVSLGDSTILPGFVDAHIHLGALAASFNTIRLSGCHSIGAIKERLADSVASEPVALVRGSGFDIDLLDGGRPPTRHDLDDALGDRPALINDRSGHIWVASTAALREANLLQPGRVDGARETEGIFMHEVSALRNGLTHLRPSKAEHTRRVESVLERLTGHGIVWVVDATASNDMERVEILRASGASFRAPGISFLWGTDSPLPPDDHPARSDIIGRKLGLYEHPDGLRPNLDELENRVRMAHAEGLAVAVHAVSLEAVAGVLHVLQRCGAGLSERPDRVEHASQMGAPEIARMARLPVLACVNPRLIDDRGDVYLADPRRSLLHRYGAMRAAGISLMAGSDAPVCDPSIIGGIRAAITRQTPSGATLGPNDRLGLMEAIRLYTRVPASWIGAPSTGNIAPGARADLTVVSGDWARGWPQHPKVVATLIEGRVAHLDAPRLSRVVTGL